MNQTDVILHKLELIAQFKAFAYCLVCSQKNKGQTLQELFLKANQALLDQLAQNPVKDPETQIDSEFSPSVSRTPIIDPELIHKNLINEEQKRSGPSNSQHLVNKDSTNQFQLETANSQYQPKEENNFNPMNQNNLKSAALDHGRPEKFNSSREAKNGQVVSSENAITNEKTLSQLNHPQTISNRIFVPTVLIDVLILIGVEKLASYIKKSFEHPGVQCFNRMEDIRFENPTIIVKQCTSRNLDDKLEFAIKSKQPSKQK